MTGGMAQGHLGSQRRRGAADGIQCSPNSFATDQLMSQYRLPCTKDNCEGSTLVDVSQAGLTVPCPKCGHTLEVPTIRGLSQLEHVVTDTPGEEQGKWGLPQAVMTVGASLTALFLVLGISLLTVTPSPPASAEYKPPTPLPLDTSFLEAYRSWIEVEKGLQPPPDSFEIREYRRHMASRRYWGIASLVLAGFSSIAIGIGWSMRKQQSHVPSRPVATAATSSSR